MTFSCVSAFIGPSSLCLRMADGLRRGWEVWSPSGLVFLRLTFGNQMRWSSLYLTLSTDNLIY